MTKEHYFPKWLTERADLRRDGIQWLDGKWVAPSAATFPLCEECNNALGTQLEGPVSRLFEEMEAGLGVTDTQAELIARWLWKFEGLSGTPFTQATRQNGILIGGR